MPRVRSVESLLITVIASLILIVMGIMVGSAIKNA